MTKTHFTCSESKKHQSTATDEVDSRKNMKKSVFSTIFAWFWITIIFTIVATITIFVIPDGFYPLAYVRLTLGAVFILFIPGFCLVNLLFPKKLPTKSSSKSLDNVERCILSIGVSIAIVPMVGLLLNYTSWGIRLTPITLSLVVLTMSFTLIAFIREYALVDK